MTRKKPSPVDFYVMMGMRAVATSVNRRPTQARATPETVTRYIQSVMEFALAKTGCDVTVEPLKHPAGSKIPLVIRVKGVDEYLFWYYPYASDCRMRNELTGALGDLNERVFGNAA